MSTYIYLHLFTYLWEFYLKISIYNYDIHHNPLHITQLTNHPMCSIVYTNHPIYNIFP